MVCILDGFGFNTEDKWNGIHMADTPVYDGLRKFKNRFRCVALSALSRSSGKACQRIVGFYGGLRWVAPPSTGLAGAGALIHSTALQFFSPKTRLRVNCGRWHAPQARLAAVAQDGVRAWHRCGSSQRC